MDIDGHLWCFIQLKSSNYIYLTNYLAYFILLLLLNFFDLDSENQTVQIIKQVK